MTRTIWVRNCEHNDGFTAPVPIMYNGRRHCIKAFAKKHGILKELKKEVDIKIYPLTNNHK